MRARVPSGLRFIGTVFAHRDLRRVELAFIGFNCAEWASWIAILVFAYNVGGATETGLVALIQLIPAAVAAPFASLLADRYPRGRVIAGAYGVQAVTMAAAGTSLLLSAPVPVVYLLSALVATSIVLTRPAQAALLPSLATNPEQLTAANVVAGGIEAASAVIGPALAGVLLAVSEPGVVFVAMAAALACSTLLVSRLHARIVPAAEKGEAFMREAIGGFATLARERHPRLLVGLVAARFIVGGAFDVLLVVLAIQLLRIGESGYGFLSAAEGLGGLVGTATAVLLVGRKRLATIVAMGFLAVGLALGPIAYVTTPLAAFALLSISGAGGTITDVAGRTLLQRLTPDRTLARVFGVLEGLTMAGLALGSAAASGLVAAFGPRVAMLVAAGFLPALAIISWRQLRRIDKVTVVPAAELRLLRNIPMFAPLPPQTLEGLAAQMEREHVPAGSEVFAQGSIGDRFYVIAEGEVSVRIDGRTVATQHAGDYFGEIALLRGVQRTATVEATGDVLLFALTREDFLAAISGHLQSSQAAETVVSERLAPKDS